MLDCAFSTDYDGNVIPSIARGSLPFVYVSVSICFFSSLQYSSSKSSSIENILDCFLSDPQAEFELEEQSV